jgi:hypothetical protein
MHLSKPLLEDLRVLAKEEDRSMASIVREAITDLLQQRTYGAPRPRPAKRRK